MYHCHYTTRAEAKTTIFEYIEVFYICEFKDLPEQLVIDADYPTTLADEYLLNQDGRLEILQVFDGSLKTPKLTGTFA